MVRTEKHDLIIGQLCNWFQRYNYSLSSAAGNTRGADLTITHAENRVLIEVNRRWHVNAESRPNIIERHTQPGVLATVFITTHPENLSRQLASVHPFCDYKNIFAFGEDEFPFLLPPLVMGLLGLPGTVRCAP